MNEEQETTDVLAQARALLMGGDVGGFIVPESGLIGRPIAILAPNGERHSWFVPVTVGNRFASFFQFLPDLTMMQYSSFQRRDDSVEGCPAADLWLDVDTIRRRAQENARPGETAEKPFLTYDRTPSRLAWGVTLTSPDGTTRILYVAGQVVWEATGTDNSLDSYDGSTHR